jgi:1,2-phenylacetyl-CoA epoxidase catalytic subunit
MPPGYRELLMEVLYANFRAEAANASLKFHQESCPLHLAPTMNDRMAMAKYWAEECGHAVMFANLLRDLGEEPTPEEYDLPRPTEMLQLPVTTFAEHALFQLFADTAGMVHLTDYEDCSYFPLRELSAFIRKEEAGHIALALKNLKITQQLPGGKEKLSEALPAWYGSAVHLFGKKDTPSPKTLELIRLGIRKQTNVELRRDYRKRIDDYLIKSGIQVPEV